MINTNIVEFTDPLPYDQAFNLQKKIQQKIISKELNSTIMLLEHNHVYTVGRSGGHENILLDNIMLKRLGVEVHESNRGGNVTYHGPGQLVCYLLFDLSYFEKDIHKFIYNIEESLILALSKFSIIGERDKKYPNGIWVQNNKIAAFGMGVYKSVTIHGFALNINTNLEYFNNINPCGIIDRGVTSMAKEINQFLNVTLVKEEILETIKTDLSLKFKRLEPRDLRELLC